MQIPVSVTDIQTQKRRGRSFVLARTGFNSLSLDWGHTEHEKEVISDTTAINCIKVPKNFLVSKIRFQP